MPVDMYGLTKEERKARAGMVVNEYHWGEPNKFYFLCDNCGAYGPHHINRAFALGDAYTHHCA